MNTKLKMAFLPDCRNAQVSGGITGYLDSGILALFIPGYRIYTQLRPEEF